MSKKGQIDSRILIYVLAIMVFSFVLLFGYKSIKSAREKSEQARLIQVRTSLRYDIESLAPNYGSTRMKEYELPSNIGEVCLIDLEMNTPGSVSSALLRTKSGIIADQIEGGMKNNLFVFDNEGGYVDSLDIGKLSIGGPGWICYKNEDEKLRVGLRGLGDKTGIIEEFSDTENLNTPEAAANGVTLEIEEIPGLELNLVASVAGSVASVKLRVEKGVGDNYLSDSIFIEMFDSIGNSLDINNLVNANAFGDSFIDIPVSDCNAAGDFITKENEVEMRIPLLPGSCINNIARYYLRDMQ